MVRNQKISVNCACKEKGGNCCDNCKSRRKRRRAHKRGGVKANFQPIHAFNPVYIQSGTPAPDPNPLLQAVQEVNSKVEKHHMEYLHNELRRRVYNSDKGHIATVKEQDTQTPHHNHISTQTPHLKMNELRDAEPVKHTIATISNPVKDSMVTATEMLQRYPPRPRQPPPSSTRRNLNDNFDEAQTPVITNLPPLPSRPVRIVSNIEDDSQAGGGAVHGTRTNPKCSACGLYGHRKNSKQCSHHAFNKN